MTSTDNDSVRFVCPKCHKRLMAPASLAGGQSRCPYCHSSVDVPRHSRTAAAIEEYPLQTGDAAPAEEPACVLVICPVCHARMHPEESQIGQQVLCPDCGAATTVTRPAEKPAKKPQRSAAEIGEYPLAAEARRKPQAASPAEQSYVAVICPVCHTRMLATADQVGSKLKCPDCGTLALVPPMPPPRPKIDVMAGADEGYALAGWDENGPVGAPPASPAPRRVREQRAEEPGEEPDEPAVKPRSRRPDLPERPFLDGTFTFPFAVGVRSRTILLTVFSLIFSAMGCAAAWLHMSGNPMGLFACAMLGGLAAVLVLMWFIVLSATVLTVLRETAEGCNAIDNWPGAVFLDWMGDCVWLFCAFCMSMTPGAALAWLLRQHGFTGEALMLLSLFFVFPIVLLSMLETNSIVGLVSLPVWRTLFSVTSGWFKFYVASGALLAVAWGLEGIASYLNVIAGFMVVSVIQAVGWLIYFRLLGRLAWYCADRTAFAELEEQLAELNDEEFDDDVDDE